MYMILDFRFNIHSFTLGISVYVNEDTPWVVLVTTKIMKRAQLLDASREIIFCDSSSSCDTLETTITILLTATKAGAVPLSILLHQGQSTESYKAAFGFLKKTFPKCFGKSDVSVNNISSSCIYLT